MSARARRLRHNLFESAISRLHTKLHRWDVNFTTRKQLLYLDDNQLRDIGLDRATAELEAKKPFWCD